VLEHQAVALGRPDGADLRDVRDDLDAERAQERLGECAAGHACCGLAGAGALEHVADVGEAVLLRPGEVGVARARQVDLRDRRLDGPGVHPLLPVRVVAIGDEQRDRAAQRAAVAHAGGDLGGVALDLHAAAATVAELAAGHVAIDRVQVELEARGQPLDDAGQAGAVRLPGGDQAQRHARKLRPLRPEA
jgi:hypothetical protein